MIADARTLLCTPSRSRPSAGDSFHSFDDSDEESRIWNCLFQSSFTIQRVRLRFHNSAEADVMTVNSLELRPDGWVVSGIRLGSGQTIEHPLHRIRDVEVLGESSVGSEINSGLPPMA